MDDKGKGTLCAQTLSKRDQRSSRGWLYPVFPPQLSSGLRPSCFGKSPAELVSERHLRSLLLLMTTETSTKMPTDLRMPTSRY